MDGNDNFALVPRPPSAVEKAEPGAKRVLSGMVADTLALVKKAQPFRIIHHDDEEWLLEMVGMAIHQKFKNIARDTFQNGDKAWEELLFTDPDLLISVFMCSVNCCTNVFTLPMPGCESPERMMVPAS